DVVGPIAVGDREAEIFLGREVVQRREVSERTAELVDTELKRLLGEAYEHARDIVTKHRDQLDRLAAALLERETLDREEGDLVARLPEVLGLGPWKRRTRTSPSCASSATPARLRKRLPAAAGDGSRSAFRSPRSSSSRRSSASREARSARRFRST